MISPQMIISESNQFVFIKGRKVAGTSVEVGLSSLCDHKDILTPITPVDEAIRFRSAGLMAQNYGADPNKLEAYQKTIRRIAEGSQQDQKKIIKPPGHYEGHMPFNKIEDIYGPIPSNWTIIGITRSPYEQALSRIKHLADREAIKKSSETKINTISDSFQKAKSFFIDRASRKKLRLNIALYKNTQHQLGPNFYLRHENLNNDYKKLLEHLGQPNASTLPHLKKASATKKLIAHDVFTRRELNIINTCFEEEFQEFNYQII